MKKPNKGSDRFDRLPTHILDESFNEILAENDHMGQNKLIVDIKSKIKVENHNDLDDEIYKDSVSINQYIVLN